MATTPPTQNAPRASLLRLAYGSAPQRRSRTTSAIINNQQTRHRGGATSSVEPGATASGDTQLQLAGELLDLVLLAADLCMLFFIRQHSGPSPPRYASQSERPAIFRESVSNVGRRRFVVDVLGILEHAHSTLDLVRARRIPLRPRIFNAIPHGQERTADT